LEVEEGEENANEGTWNVNVSNHQSVNYHDTTEKDNHRQSAIRDHGYTVPAVESHHEVDIKNNMF